jgi:hypothetical protein
VITKKYLTGTPSVFIEDENSPMFFCVSMWFKNGLFCFYISYNSLYFKLDLNTEDKIGNWVFKNDIPFNTVFANVPSSNKKMMTAAPCGSQSFMNCMNCNIVQTCFSDWVCGLACGLFTVSCVGGSALMCAVS